MRRQQVLGRARSDAGKHRAPAGQADVAGTAEMENVVADRKKQPEYFGAADDCQRTAWGAERLPGLLEVGAAGLHLSSPRSKTPHPAEGRPAFDGERVRSTEPNAARYADYCFWPPG